MKKVVLKSLFAVGAPAYLRRKKKDAVTVLSLHRISSERDFFFNPIQPSTFKRILEYCDKYYSIVQFRDLEKKTSKPKLVLSFDDGYYDFLDIALPILNQMGIPCNHNVVNDCLMHNKTIWTQELNDAFNVMRRKKITKHRLIDPVSVYQGNWHSWYLGFFKHLLQVNAKDRHEVLSQLSAEFDSKKNQRMLTWQEFKLCVEQHGVEPGSHSYTHDSLSSITDERQYAIEIKQAVTELRERLSVPVEIYALPNGQYNAKVLQQIEENGIKYVLLMNDKPHYLNATNKICNTVSRIGLLDESYQEAILRIELFHSRLR